MDIKERISQYPNRKIIKRQDTNENFIADIATDDAIEGNIGQVGTVITADLLNDVAKKTNWNLPIGTIFQAARTDLPAGCVRLDGEVYNSNTFPNFFNMLSNGKFGTPISFSAYQTELNANSGNCGKFGINGQTFKVPTLTNGMVIAHGTNIGEYCKGGLPNIKGTILDTKSLVVATTSGAFTTSQEASVNYNGSNSGAVRNFYFDASRSNTIYSDNNTTVTPAHMKYPYFIIVSNEIPESSQTVWNNFVSNLNNKANKDLSNVTVPVDGGAQGIDYVIEYKTGLSGTNYTNGWYRKYKSGWIEQGGRTTINEKNDLSIALPKIMANANYSITSSGITKSTSSNTETISASIYPTSASTINMTTVYIDPNTIIVSWEIKGKGA